MRLALLLLIAACTSLDARPRVNWIAVDEAMREARWRVAHCVEPNSEKCDALWSVRDELEAMATAAREAVEGCPK